MALILLPHDLARPAPNARRGRAAASAAQRAAQPETANTASPRGAHERRHFHARALRAKEML